MKIRGVWCLGDYKKRPITFKNTNIIINWSYYNLKLEIYGSRNDLEIVLELYDFVCTVGEWTDELIKPIIWMQIENNKKSKKSKKIIEIKKLKELFKNEEFFKITIFFETTIQESPLKEDYTTSNSYWISCIGGLYNIADPFFYIENEKTGETREAEIYTETKTPFSVENYENENLEEYALETAKTAKKLYQTSKKWELFKFNWVE